MTEPILTDFGLVEPAMARVLEKLTPEEAAAVWRWGGTQYEEGRRESMSPLFRPAGVLKPPPWYRRLWWWLR